LWTIEPIKWVSCKQLAKIYSDEKYLELLFEVDNKKYVFKSKVYFDRNFLKNISFVDTVETFENKTYLYKVVINSKQINH